MTQKTLNNNIEETYVSFEVAKLLKQKGFDVNNTLTYYGNDSSDATGTLYQKPGAGAYTFESLKGVLAPTQSIALEWLRVNFNIILESMLFTHALKDSLSYRWRIWIRPEAGKNCSNKIAEAYFKTPQEALEAGLLYTLKNLI